MRLTYPSREWFAWYRGVLSQLAASDDFGPADVLARWVAMAVPSYDPLGPPPQPEVLAKAPRHRYVEVDGVWWVRDEEPPSSRSVGPGISWDTVGPYLRLPSGEVIRDRRQATLRLGRLADDPAMSMFLKLFLTGRQDDKRSSMQAPTLARALVTLGLRDEGSNHLDAVRLWLRWEHELGGQLADHYMHSILQRGSAVDLAERDQLAAYLRNVSLADRRIWRALGLAVEFASSEVG